MEVVSVIFFFVSYLVSALCTRFTYEFLILSAHLHHHPTLSVSLIYIISYCMSLSTFTSSAYAFLLRPVLENSQLTLYNPIYFGFRLNRVGKILISIFLGQLLVVSVPFYLLSSGPANHFALDNHITPSVFLVDFIYYSFAFILFVVLYYISAYRTPISPSIRMYFDHCFLWGFCSVIFSDLAVPPQAYYSDTLIHLMYLFVPPSLLISYIVLKERLDMGTLPTLVVWIYERKKLMEFLLGAMWTIIFQLGFRFTSTAKMVALLFCATAWLCNVAMVQPATDFGVLSFLLVDASLSSAINVFQLRVYTWFVFATCFLLYILRWKLDKVTLRYEQLCGRRETILPRFQLQMSSRRYPQHYPPLRHST